MEGQKNIVMHVNRLEIQQSLTYISYIGKFKSDKWSLLNKL